MKLAVCGKKGVGKTTLMEMFFDAEPSLEEKSFTDIIDSITNNNSLSDNDIITECPSTMTVEDFDLLKDEGFFLIHISTNNNLGSVIEEVHYPTEEKERVWDVWIHNVGEKSWLKKSAEKVYKTYHNYSE